MSLEQQPAADKNNEAVAGREVAIFVVQNGVVRQSNAAAARIFGFARPEEMVGLISFNDLVAPAERAVANEYLNRLLAGKSDRKAYCFNAVRRDGTPLTAELHGCQVECEGQPAAACVIIDATRRSAYEAELERRETYDALTGLPGRTLLLDRINQAVALARRADELLAVLWVNLDGFRGINERHGRETGDLVLRIVSRRFAGTLRASDTLARVGGDEFVVVASGLTFGDDVIPVAQKLGSALASPLAVAGQELQVDASIGIALFPAVAEDAQGLCRAAEAAMYLAKQKRRGSYLFACSGGESSRPSASV